MPEVLREPPEQGLWREGGGGWQVDSGCVNTSKMSVYDKCYEDNKAQGHVAKTVSSWRWHVSCGLQSSREKQARLEDGQVPRPLVRQWLTQAFSPLSILAKEPPESPCPGGSGGPDAQGLV